jgi:hypothetical protein
MQIISNGSKWAGQAPDTIDTLIDVLGRETLDPRFEDYGDFISTSESDPTFVWVFGNFQTVSHVFNISGSREELVGVIQAIEANKETADYKEARRLLTMYREDSVAAL